MYAKYFLGVSFIIVTVFVFGVCLPLLVSHDSDEGPILGLTIGVVYFPIAFAFVKRVFFHKRRKDAPSKQEEQDEK